MPTTYFVEGDVISTINDIKKFIEEDLGLDYDSKRFLKCGTYISAGGSGYGSWETYSFHVKGSAGNLKRWTVLCFSDFLDVETRSISSNEHSEIEVDGSYYYDPEYADD